MDFPDSADPLIGKPDARIEENELDDDHIRTGTFWTATTHAITAVIGSGVLALPWSMAQMGWIFGPLALVVFAYITYYAAVLLSDCYRSPDPVRGKRNRTYVDAVRACLGPRNVLWCGVVQYALLWGTLIGYTITTVLSLMTVERSICLRRHDGQDADCKPTGNKYMVLFGLVEIVLSQFPSLEKITLISVIAAVMSFAYSLIGLYLCTDRLASHGSIEGSLFGPTVGVDGLSASTRVWHGFQALGNIAFAYSYALILIEIQDTLRSNPPENKTMKKASKYGIGVTALFYVLLGCIGYAAFGNGAPGNMLTGFKDPLWVLWLVDIANIAVIVHLVGAYQVYGQPIFAKHEKFLVSRLSPLTSFHRAYTLRLPFLRWKFTVCQLVLRTVFVAVTTVIAMMFPFFNAVVGLLGTLAFWPLTVYFPVTMYMAQARVRRGQTKWVLLQALSVVCFLVSMASAVGSLADISERLKSASFFNIEL